MHYFRRDSGARNFMTPPVESVLSLQTLLGQVKFQLNTLHIFQTHASISACFMNPSAIDYFCELF